MKNKELESIYNETMEIHDVIMPEMSTIHKSKKKIRKTLENTSQSDVLRRKELLNGMSFLESADDAMMDWMAEFKKPKDNAPFEESKKYLLSEKEKITKVKKMMVEAINSAKELTE